MYISKKGIKLTEGPQPLVEAHFKCAQNPWDEHKNPDGYINLGTAENHLVFDLLEPKLNRNPEFRESHTHYDILYGNTEFRKELALFITKMTNHPADKEQIVVASGSSAIIDMLMVALCEPGDGVLIPAPYYAGFDHDLKSRAGVVPVPVHLNPADNYTITNNVLQAAILQAGKRQIKSRALLITSPNNPLGRTYTEDDLRLFIHFAKEHKLELISDELYAKSVFGEAKHLSLWKLAAEENVNVHLVYGFAKDFGLSGFKTGLLCSTSQEVLDVMRELAYFAPVSNATQQLLLGLLSDQKFLESFFETNKNRLKQAWRTCDAALNRAEIPHPEANAGFFAWLDLRNRLTAGEQGEMQLYKHILNHGKVNLSPGLVFNAPVPGFFRLCYARPDSMIETAVNRISNAVANLP